MNSPVSDNNTTPVSDNNTIDPEKTTEGVMNFVNNINAQTGSIANNIGNGARELGNDATNNINAQREKANNLIADGQLKWSEQKEKGKQWKEQKQAEFENFKAKRQQEIDNGESYNAGVNGLKNMFNQAGEKANQLNEDRKKAQEVATNEAKRVHAETSAGILAGEESKPTGGMGANTPMLSSSGAATVGGRRRRRRSRKKKKKSKRKSRRKKTRKRKSRKSRKKRRKKSKKSRRRRRR